MQSIQEDVLQSLQEHGLAVAGGLAYKAKTGGDAFHIFSVMPDVQRGRDQEPMLSFIPMPEGGFLNLTVELGPRKAQTEALEVSLREAELVSVDTPIALHELTGKIIKIVLLLGDRSGAFTELGSSRGSGTAPYSALFSVQLKQNEVPLVNAALNGEAELLKACYDVELGLPVTLTATLRADTAPLLAHLVEQRITADTWDRARAYIAIEQMLAEQSFVSIKLQGDGDSAVRAELVARLIERLLDWLELRMQDVPEDCQQSVTFEEHLEFAETLQLTLTTDAANWGASGLAFATDPP